jgi:hypothetical protein
VLGQQHLEQGGSRYETGEAALVDDGKGGLVVMDGFPGCLLLNG